MAAIWRRPSVRAAMLAAGVFVLGSAIESLIIRHVAQDVAALEFISDSVLALALGGSTFLWLRLRETRMALLEAERRQLVFETQLSIAADIQHRLLPEPMRQCCHVAWAASLIPAQRIGGDYYDFQEGDGELIALVADISGKGIPAALLLAYVRAVFHETARVHREPAAIAGALSAAVFHDTGGSPYLTAIIVRLEYETRRLTSCNAGHPPGVIVAEGGLQMLTAGGPPIGLFPDLSYTQETVHIPDGTIGALVTDGVTERLAEGTEALARLMRDLARTPQSAESVCEAVQAAAAESSGPPGVEGWQDDRTVLAFVYRTAESGTARL